MSKSLKEIDAIFRELSVAVATEIENGIIPWSANPIPSINVTTREPYAETNSLIQYFSAKAQKFTNPIWASQQKWISLNATIKSDEQPTPIIYWGKDKTPKMLPGYNIKQISNYSENLLKPVEFSSVNTNKYIQQIPTPWNFCIAKDQTAILRQFYMCAKYTQTKIKIDDHDNTDAINEIVADMVTTRLAYKFGIDPSLYTDPNNFAAEWANILKQNHNLLTKLSLYVTRCINYLDSHQHKIRDTKPEFVAEPTTQPVVKVVEPKLTQPTQPDNQVASEMEIKMSLREETKMWINVANWMHANGESKTKISEVTGLGYMTVMKLLNLQVDPYVLTPEERSLSASTRRCVGIIKELDAIGKHNKTEISRITGIGVQTISKILGDDSDHKTDHKVELSPTTPKISDNEHRKIVFIPTPTYEQLRTEYDTIDKDSLREMVSHLNDAYPSGIPETDITYTKSAYNITKNMLITMRNSKKIDNAKREGMQESINTITAKFAETLQQMAQITHQK